MVDTFVTSNTNITAQFFYKRAFLDILYSRWIFRQFAMKEPIPANNGKTVKWRYFDKLSAATTSLTEGTAPTGSKATLNEISATVSSYGDWIQISDEVGLFDIDGNLLITPRSVQNIQLLAGQCLDTLDVLARNILYAGTNVYYAGAPDIASRGAIGVSNQPSMTDFEAIVENLESNDIKKITPQVQASVGQGTHPIAESYMGLVGPKSARIIRNLDGFIGVQRYGNSGQAYANEIGALADVGIRFCMTGSNEKVFSAAGAGGIDVHACLVFGQEAFGEVDLQSLVTPNALNDVSIIAKPFNTGDKSDPLDQIATMGWKIPAWVMKIIRQAAMYRYEYAVTQ